MYPHMSMVNILEFICFVYLIVNDEFHIVRCFEGAMKLNNDAQCVTKDMEITKSKNILGSCTRNSSSHAAYQNLKRNVISLKQQCGDLCEMKNFTVVKRISSENFYDHIEKNINCEGIWNDTMFEELAKFEYPPQRLPKYLQPFFTYDGLVDIEANYYDNYYETTANHTGNAWGNISGCPSTTLRLPLVIPI